jgi:hypothetical protein
MNLREALAIQRLDTMRRRRAAMEARAKANACTCAFCAARKSGRTAFDALREIASASLDIATPPDPKRGTH